MQLINRTLHPTDLTTDLNGSVDSFKFLVNFAFQCSIEPRVAECKLVIARLLRISHFKCLQKRCSTRRYVVCLKELGYVRALYRKH